MPEQAPEFSLAEAPLEGWNLIEANAGTGKTYSLTGLYLRLLLERKLEPEEILVVTFTRAATSELKTRLLARLTEAGAMLRGTVPPDPLIAAIGGRLDDPEAAIRRLERTVRAFDLAQVHTLHGFCQQLLNEFSFAVGFDPERELIEDESAIIDPLIQRQWRRLAEDFSAGFAAYVAARRDLHPAAMGTTVRRLLDKPYAALVGPETGPLTALEGDFEACRGALSTEWAEHAPRLMKALAVHRGLNQRAYKPLQIEAQWQAAETLLADPWRHLKLIPFAARLGQGALIDGTNRGFEAPTDPLFQRIEAYLEALEALRAAYRAAARGLPLAIYRGVGEALAHWKRQQSVITYRDLIMDLDSALKGPTGAAIRTAVGRRYRVALVDEFQDTDPNQFDILRALFPEPAATVFLVGDPKQSLYGFRGADVHAYLEARSATPKAYRLTRDWRATPSLLDALNRLFCARQRAFVLPQIGFSPSEAASRESAHIEIDGVELAPLVAWRLPAGRSKPVLRGAAAEAVAAEIERLLDPERRARIVGSPDQSRPLAAADIAVLVHRHDQAAEVAGALNRIGIACIQPGVDSVFDTEEAEELERVLHGVCYAELPGRLAGALSTRLLGQDAELAAALGCDDEVFERWFERFQNYRIEWEGHGITALVTALIKDFGVPARWLPRVDGHRRLTNLYHLVELMERQLDVELTTTGEQLEWLHLQRQSTEFPGEEALLRLESDDDLVSILTIHKSKGLQFPLVICPYLWDERRTSAPRWIEYHHGADQRLTIDFGGPNFEQALVQHGDEEAGEGVRRAYVAITRARIRCCFVWGVAVGTGASPLAWLLGPDGESRVELEQSFGGSAAAREQRFDESLDRLEALGVALEPLPRRPAAAARPAATPQWARYRTPVQVRPGWSVHSYSSLAGSGWDEASDYDHPFGPREPEPGSGTGIHELPAGARTGLMVHELFEELDDFASPVTELITRTGTKLEKFGFGPELAPSLGAQLHGCLQTPLLRESPGLMLAQVAPGDAIKEMEFHFAVADARLEAVWARIRGANAAPRASVIRGFVRGFIDLIIKFKNKFYIIDYKTNYLGNSDKDYHADGLGKAIREHAYDLQFHLYTLALDRYLSQRWTGYRYARDFGGVLYLFVRGMDPALGPERGVFYERPAPDVIAALDRVLRA